MRLIAEDLLLLLLDDEDGRAEIWVRGNLDFALAGALLAELALDGVVDVSDAKGFLSAADVTVDDSAAVADPLLQHAVAIIARRTVRRRRSSTCSATACATRCSSGSRRPGS